MEIDHIVGHHLAKEKVERYSNELRALEYLSTGLNFLNTQVSEIEAEVISRNEGVIFEGYGNSPGLEDVPQDLVACAFHWYSVTVCNYALLVGWILNDGSSKKAKKYQKSVLENVLLWRNKVGAHFAQADPLKDDSFAVRTQSVIFPVGYRDGAFYSPPLTLTFSSPSQEHFRPDGIADWRWRLLRRSKAGTISSGPEMTWSLTRTHSELSQRYSHLVTHHAGLNR